MTKEDLQQFREMMNEVIDEKIQPINNHLNKIDNRLDKIEEQISEMKEDINVMKTDIEEIKIDAKITRATTNEIGKWVELNATPSNPYPTEKTAI